MRTFSAYTNLIKSQPWPFTISFFFFLQFKWSQHAKKNIQHLQQHPGNHSLSKRPIEQQVLHAVQALKTDRKHLFSAEQLFIASNVSSECPFIYSEDINRCSYAGICEAVCVMARHTIMLYCGATVQLPVRVVRFNLCDRPQVTSKLARC